MTRAAPGAAQVTLAEEILAGSAEVPLTESSNAELLDLVALDIDTAVAE